MYDVLPHKVESRRTYFNKLDFFISKHLVEKFHDRRNCSYYIIFTHDLMQWNMISTELLTNAIEEDWFWHIIDFIKHSS